MSNLAEELASRGSKLCMQICVNNIEDDFARDGKIARKSRKHLLDDLIDLGEIEWISPLTKENYREYQLNDISKKYPKETDLENMDWSFWPSYRQPQWDAIGITADSTLVLVEAKAHTSEIEGPGTKSCAESREKISKEILTVMGDDPVWMGKYYQTANRMLFLDKIRKHYGMKRNVVLIFLNFTNDITYIPEVIGKWDSYITKMKSEHTFPAELDPYVKYIYLDIWNDKGVEQS